MSFASLIFAVPFCLIFTGSNLFVLVVMVAVVIIACRASTSAHGATDFVYICTDGEKPETKQKRLEAKYTALQIVPSIEKLGTPKVRFCV